MTEAEVAFTIDRASLEHLIAAGAPACGEDRIRAAIERADYDDATIRALARARLGLPLPPALVADVLVGVESMEIFLALARHISGDALPPMLGLLRGERFAEDVVGLEQTVYAAFVSWQLARPELVRPVLVPRLRRLARLHGMALRAAGLIAWLVGQLADPHLTSIHEEHHGRDDRLGDAAGSYARRMWSSPLDELVALLHERATELPFPGVPVRAAPKVGRNELCPCGSGKKYKRCCADRPAAAPIGADPSRAERLRALEPRLEYEQVRSLTRADLARLDLGRLRDVTVVAVMRRQAQLRDWRRACLAVDEIARRGERELADEHLQDTIRDALDARQYTVAAELLARCGQAGHDLDLQLRLALARRDPEALARLEAAALAVAAGSDELGEADVAHAVLMTSPALGLLIARGALRGDALLDGEILLEAIEEARDELGLPPGDHARELFAALGGVQQRKGEVAKTAAERARLARTTAALRTELDETTERLAKMLRQVAEHQRELERADRASADAAQRAPRPTAPDPERQALRSKIDELQALIREGNEERGELRRQLSTATESRFETADPSESTPREREAAARGRAPDVADEGVEDLPAGTPSRTVLIPRFGAAAVSALESVPRNVAAGAMRTVGALAAGDPAAWRGIKQAKDMPRQVLMARIGIHHRLLFRTGDALEVIDLVTRGSLMTTLKRLRSA